MCYFGGHFLIYWRGRATLSGGGISTFVATIIDHLSPILQACGKLLVEKDASRNQKIQMVSNINRLILPLNAGSATLLRNATISVAPITGCENFHERREVERKKAAEVKIFKATKKVRR